MPVASLQFPCKCCFAAGKATGSKLTLDGDCESCWHGGKSLFKRTVKSIREQLKKDTQDAPCQEAFFKAFGQAKASGVSEGVLKKLCEQYQEKSMKRTRSPEAGDQGRTFKKSRALNQHNVTGCKTNSETFSVNITMGLSGKEVSVDVDVGMSIEGLRSKVRRAYPEAGERFIKFSSDGSVVSTGEQLISCIQGSQCLCASFLKSTLAMDVQELQGELSLDDNEFQGHFHVLRLYTARHTPADVAHYLWDNQVLLTATQAQRIFDALVGKISRAQTPANLGRGGPRAQLILALHSFCSEPYAIWEPIDDCDECLWANMHWGEHGLGPGRYHLRGRLHNISSSSSSSSPHEAQRQDVSRLRAVLNARRSDESKPLESLTFPGAYNYSWRSLA